MFLRATKLGEKAGTLADLTYNIFIKEALNQDLDGLVLAADAQLLRFRDDVCIRSGDNRSTLLLQPLAKDLVLVFAAAIFVVIIIFTQHALIERELFHTR